MTKNCTENEHGKADTAKHIEIESFITNQKEEKNADVLVINNSSTGRRNHIMARANIQINLEAAIYNDYYVLMCLLSIICNIIYFM